MTQTRATGTFMEKARAYGILALVGVMLIVLIPLFAWVGLAALGIVIMLSLIGFVIAMFTRRNHQTDTIIVSYRVKQ